MKKKHSFKMLLCLALTFSMLLTSTVFALASTQEREDVTIDDMLAKLNSVLNEDEWLTEMPYDDNIDIPDNRDYISEPPERFFIENMTEDEIAEVISRIANGENVIFGNGVDYDFSQENQSNNTTEYIPIEGARWKGGGTDKTHQWLVSRAFVILGNEQSSIRNLFTSTQIAQINLGSDWPDENETGPNTLVGIPTYSWHFYNYPTGTNYAWDTYPTAKDRFITWYNSAVSKYNNSGGNAIQKNEAFHDLGKAIHYLSDIGSPVHTGDRAANILSGIFADPVLALNHTCYETDADNNKSSYAVTTGGYYSWFSSNTLSYIAETNASISYSYYSSALYPTFPPYDNYWSAVKYPIQNTQKDVAGLLYKFYKDTSNLKYN